MHVVMVDAQNTWREAVVNHLERLAYRVDGLRTLSEMHSRLEQCTPDILILDADLPDGKALPRVAEIRLVNHRLGIVILSCRRSSVEYVIGMTIGVDYYLAKPIALDELAATLAGLSRRIGLLDCPNPPTIARWRYTPRIRQLTAPDGAIINLTDQESRLVSTLITAESTTVVRNALVLALGTSSANYDHHRLDTLIHRLRSKTRGHFPELQLRTVYGLGYACVTPVDLIGDTHRISGSGPSVA